MNRLLIVGCGPGAAACLTREALDAVAGAEVLYGAARLLPLFPESCAECVALERFDAAALARIEADLREKRVAVLVSGDPGVFSFSRLLVRHFGVDGCRVIPGLSSVQVAFARIGCPWQEVRIVSAHGRELTVPVEMLSNERAVAVLGGGEPSVQAVRRVIEALLPTHEAWLCRDLTLPGETVRRLDEPPPAEELTSPRTLLLFVWHEEEAGQCPADCNGKE